VRRYENTQRIMAGQAYATPSTVAMIRLGISNGTIAFNERILQESQRIDVIAGIEYGDSKLWWVIAAASNIGWSLQSPPGTLIRVPKLDDVARVI
jgi:hypothetical protein